MIQKCFGILLCMLVLMVGYAPAFGQDSIIAVADRWMPYNGRAGTRDEGYAVEILRAIFEPMGHHVEYREMPWNRAVDDVLEGKADILIGSLKSDMSKYIFPQETLGRDSLCFYTNQPDWKFTGPESLAGFRIGLVKGYIYRDWVLELLELSPGQFHIMHGDEPVVRLLGMLKDDRIQVIPGNKAVVDYYLKALGLRDDIHLAGCYDDTKDEYLYFALSPADPERSKQLGIALDKGVSLMRKTGQLNHLLIKYGLKDWVQLR
ncbi:transporter substrate-binding domain-containing protein [uncultured Pseudodesulfovibrio sp.]|uniref:substrate-binding periplasmic protein n=1 Tax=uncultured Pseudodesulfovibrio sp. TaxID=2035858 RepID=UPI0029C6636B|nr:transporter substrate-binding domain-containing protein [uncultured Pseudodesulfovibrio sp.]